MKKGTFIMVLCVLLPILAFAQKPKWVGNTPHERNLTYRFVEVVSLGSSIESARMSALHQLTLNEKIASAAKVGISSGTLTTIEDVYTEHGVTGKQTDKSYINVTVNDEEYTLQAVLVDEYVVNKSFGKVQLHSLYMVAVCDNPIFDRTYITTAYGVVPMFMSVIPGAGQWYKGNKTKGLAFFAAEAVALGCLIYTENARSNYISMMYSHPYQAYQYKTLADNYGMARNCCVGVAAAVYLYNLIDALVAPGARRVEVNSRNLKVSPIASHDFSGFMLSYNF